MFVWCDSSDCAYYKDRLCNKDEIWLYDGECDDYVDFRELNPKEWKQEYWRACKDKETGEIYRTRSEGKRYEICGLVVYTNADDRNGIDEIGFTEEEYGIWIPHGKQITEENVQKYREFTKKNCTPVMELPEREEKRDGV